MRKEKFSAAEKISIVKEILAGKTSYNGAAKRLGVDFSTVRTWVSKYTSIGIESFNEPSTNRHYSREVKEKAVHDYLRGEGSYRELCEKYQIKSTAQLKKWVKMYNSHGEIRSSGTGGNIMTKGRNTTFDERVEIVEYCIAHNRNYAETAEKYKISYQQARSYTVKYDNGGVEALQDRRGKPKSKEDMTELERLRAENRILRAEKERIQMEVDFLKKLDELERRRG